jgi:hypothetical protein
MITWKPGLTAVILGIALIMIPESAESQWNFVFSLDREFNNNPLRYVSAEESWVSSAAFSIEHKFRYMRIGYSGYYNHFDAIGDRNFYWHQGYISGENKKTGWGVSAEQRMNRSLYDFYDYRAASGFTGYGLGGGIWQVQLSAGGGLNAFPNVSELNHKKGWVTVQGRRSFQTRTSIFAGSGLHYKRYNNVVLYDPDDSVSSPTNSTDVSQLVFWLRLTQSITPTTGLAAYTQRRIITGGTNRFSSVYWFNGVLESELFDDPMGYEGNSVGIELTQLLPSEMIMKAAFNTMNKAYPDQGIFLDNETYIVESHREDTFRTFWVRVQKGIALSPAQEIYAVISLNYQNIQNTSNSYWFGYSTSYISIGVDLLF